MHRKARKARLSVLTKGFLLKGPVQVCESQQHANAAQDLGRAYREVVDCEKDNENGDGDTLCLTKYLHWGLALDLRDLRGLGAKAAGATWEYFTSWLVGGAS
jgi:hypothetical protein